jgi:hypothetical protein
MVNLIGRSAVLRCHPDPDALPLSPREEEGQRERTFLLAPPPRRGRWLPSVHFTSGVPGDHRAELDARGNPVLRPRLDRRLYQSRSDRRDRR